MWVSGAPQYCQPDSWRMTLKHLLLVTDFPSSSSKVEVVTHSPGGFTDVNSSSLAAAKSSRVLSVCSVAPAIYESGVLQETLTLAHARGRRRVKNGSWEKQYYSIYCVAAKRIRRWGRKGEGWAGNVTDVLRKIFVGGGTRKRRNESCFDTGKKYLVFMQPLAWW